jgi:hypothetical protein
MQRYSDKLVGKILKIKNPNKEEHFINNYIINNFRKTKILITKFCVSDGNGNPVAQQSGARD